MKTIIIDILISGTIGFLSYFFIGEIESLIIFFVLFFSLRRAKNSIIKKLGKNEAK